MWQRHDSSKSQVLAIGPCLAKLHVLCKVPGHQLSLGTESTCSCRVVCADWRLATSGWEGGQCAQLLSVTALSSWRLSRDNRRPPHGDWQAWDASEVGSRALDFIGFQPSAHTTFRAHLTSCSHCQPEELRCEVACVPSPTPWPPMGHFLCEFMHMCVCIHVEVRGQPQELSLRCSPVQTVTWSEVTRLVCAQCVPPQSGLSGCWRFELRSMCFLSRFTVLARRW